MLAPFLFAIAFIFYRKNDSNADDDSGKSTPQRFLLPWFAVWFLAIIILNSILPLPQSVVDGILFIDNILLMMAMAALGLSTQFITFKAAGPRSFVLGLIIFVWLIIAGIALQLLFA